MSPTLTETDLRAEVARTLAETPLVAVVRTHDDAEAERQARLFIAGGARMIEVTFTVPGAVDLVRRLLAERGDAPHRIGMGPSPAPSGRGRRSPPVPSSSSPRTSPPRRRRWRARPGCT
jgi:hypothetical protein